MKSFREYKEPFARKIKGSPGYYRVHMTSGAVITVAGKKRAKSIVAAGFRVMRRHNYGKKR